MNKKKKKKQLQMSDIQFHLFFQPRESENQKPLQVQKLFAKKDLIQL